MAIKIRKYQAEDLPEMLAIWNEVVDEGRAFPHKEALDMESAREFFAGQSHCGVAVDEASGKIHGLYILHPIMSVAAAISATQATLFQKISVIGA